jgi:subtilisin family serine protease/subtilisin-like proprotein convertase family protein
VLLCLSFADGGRADQSSEPTVRFQFREPHAATYKVQDIRSTPGSGAEWVKAWPEDGSTNHVEMGRRVMIHLRAGANWESLSKQSALRQVRAISENVLILQAEDAWIALSESQRLSSLPEVVACYPVMRRAASLHGPYSFLPTDQWFPVQWYLEHRNSSGGAAGIDLNVRAAWPYAQGAGVTIAVADVGVELTHPDLAPRAGGPHHNFYNPTNDAVPAGTSTTWAHGTEVAGLALAEFNNGIGMAGVAPKARLASWVIFTTNVFLVDDEHLMDMYQYHSNEIGVQNHSWGKSGSGQRGPTFLEKMGISNAVAAGRDGRGVIMVRAAGNERAQAANANDDGYPSDPLVIAVGAARSDGRVTTYSEPGACVLLAAPSGDTTFSNTFSGLFTTDLLGAHGANAFNYFPPYQSLSDYVFDALGFSGTSASTPLVAGVAALVLSANTNLTWRDVQQVLIHSARHFDLADPDLSTNGAGFRVSHNQGFGVPDAGLAVFLARRWPNRPPATNIALVATNSGAIPDDGLRLVITGEGLPAGLASIRALAGTGPHPDAPTIAAPLVDVGLATNPITINLIGKAALIERGINNYADKVGFAARAGAAFAVIYNYGPENTNSDCPGGDEFCWMGGTDFTPIPSVFIGNTDGVALKSFFSANPDAHAQLRLESTNYIFNVTNTLLCEHVTVRVMTDHPLRGDLRITLLSPQGTRSILQSYNIDTAAGPVDWTYSSTHHFYESSAGQWTVSFTDEFAENTGNVLYVGLTIEGVPMTDTDHDGLDDAWEMAHFGSLLYGAQDDPDGDGYSNAREQVMGSDPQKMDIPFAVDLSRWNTNLSRVSWPGVTNRSYQVWGGTNLTHRGLITNIAGTFPVTEWFTPSPRNNQQYFHIRTAP